VAPAPFSTRLTVLGEAVGDEIIGFRGTGGFGRSATGSELD